MIVNGKQAGAKSLLGWLPEVSIDERINKTITWYKDSRIRKAS